MARQPPKDAGERAAGPGDCYDEVVSESRPMVDRQMSVASSERMRFVEGEFKVSFASFCRAVMSADPRELFEWRQNQRVIPAKEEKFDRFFITEHFKMFTKQAGRDLDRHDLDTIIWLKKLYDGKVSAKEQPLPYRREPANFWKHLLDCEKTVRGVAAVWCLQDPKVLFGFVSRPDAVEVLRNARAAHPTGTFFFRLSNSEPTKLVLVYARKRTHEREVAPEVVKAVANKVCTRMETDCCPAVQCSVKCKACNVACCISCAKICHASHELSAVSTLKEFCCTCKGCKIMRKSWDDSRPAHANLCWVSHCPNPPTKLSDFCAAHQSVIQEASPVQGEYVVEQILIDSFASMGQFSEFLLSHADLKKVLPDGKGRELSREELLGKFDDPYLATVFKQYSDFTLVYDIEQAVTKINAAILRISDDDEYDVQDPKKKDSHGYDAVVEVGVGPYS